MRISGHDSRLYFFKVFVLLYPQLMMSASALGMIDVIEVDVLAMARAFLGSNFLI